MTDNNNNEPKDRADWIVEQYAQGKMGPATCARLMMLEFARSEGMEEDELEELERQLEREQGK